MNFILCGLPKSGKTVIGKLVAKELHWNFIDTDQLIEQAFKNKTQKSWTCRDIFQREGEAEFRKLEKEQLQNLIGVRSSVISLGGGSVVDAACKALVKKIGTVIYLKSSPQIIWQRISNSGIPAYLNQENPEDSFYRLASQRILDYESIAEKIIETDFLTEIEMVIALVDWRRINGK